MGGRSVEERTIISVYRRRKSGKFEPYVDLLGDRRSAGSVKTLAFSQDGRHLISGGSDNRIRIWDTNGWHEKVVLEGHDGDLNAIAVAIDHVRFASGSDDGTVRIWDARVLLTKSELDLDGMFFLISSYLKLLNTMSQTTILPIHLGIPPDTNQTTVSERQQNERTCITKLSTDVAVTMLLFELMY